MCDFKRGNQVVCVDGRFGPSMYGDEASFPVEGRIYTVREVVQTPKRGPGVRLIKCQSRQFDHDLGGLQESCFAPSRFRLAPPTHPAHSISARVY